MDGDEPEMRYSRLENRVDVFPLLVEPIKKCARLVVETLGLGRG